MKHIFLILLASFTLVSCSKDDKSAASQAENTALNSTAESTQNAAVLESSVETTPATQADFDFTTLVLGGQVYQKNCAACHGKEAEGQPDWRKRKPDGRLKPPPLDGTGHMWHHSKDLLLFIIKNGTMSKGGDMPAWGDKLTFKEREAAFYWLQSKWPKDVYESWLEINKR